MTHQIEHEYKLTASDPEVLSAIRKSTLVHDHLVPDSIIPARDFKARYYDTHDLILHDLRWSFRARQEGKRWRAALKIGNALENGLLKCQEYQADISGWLETPSVLPDGLLREKLLSQLQHDDALHERVRIDMQRHQCELNIEGIHVEMVTDAGTISANGQSVTLYEVEVEQRNGDLETIQHFIDQLADDFPLQPSTQSKHQLGLELFEV